MSVSLWAYDDLKCDGYPCPHDCDICPIKDEHRCYECKYFQETGLICTGTYGRCVKEDYPVTVNSVWKACEDFEEIEDV